MRRIALLLALLLVACIVTNHPPLPAAAAAAAAIPSDDSDPHPSHFPSVQIRTRTAAERLAEAAADDAAFDAWKQRHDELDAAEDNPASSPRDSSYDAATRSFLDRASSTLAQVMQHDSRAIFHYKQMLTRAKRALKEKRFDDSATLFQEASSFYFDALRAPYARIASSEALGSTIEERMARRAEQERVEALSPAQQFRQKELAAKAHVHTAFMEFQQTLHGNKKKRAATRPQQERKEP